MRRVWDVQVAWRRAADVNTLVRLLLLVSAICLVFTLHLPTHLASTLGGLLSRRDWIDTVQVVPVPALETLFWLPLAALTLALVLRNRGRPLREAAPHLSRLDLALPALAMLTAIAIRAWPLLLDDWIKPNYDEGVYLGGAWLMTRGARPYADFVFPHLPGALLLLLPAASLLQPDQVNAGGVLAGRFIALLSDGAAVGLVYLAARTLVARPGALLAAVVYASDALLVAFARNVRLEPLQAPWLAAGAWLLLATLNGRRWGAAAGGCFAVAVMVKITGAVAPAAAVLVLLMERRWRTLAELMGGLLGGAALVGAIFVVDAGWEIARQTVLLQLARPVDSAAGRWDFLLRDRATAFTALAAFGGLCGIVATTWRRRVASGWIFLALWTLLTLLMFAYGASFYDHYYGKLALPLALVAGALPSLSRRRLAPLGMALALLPAWWGQARLWPQVDRAPRLRQELDLVRSLSPAEAVLDLMPFDNVWLGRAFTRPAAGPFILDTFLGTLYLDSPLNRRWPDAVTTMGAAISAAQFVVVDPWTSPLPGLTAAFMEQPLVHGSTTRLYTRVDQPAATVEVGSDLMLMRSPPAWIESRDDQRWIVQPLNWRAPATPASDLALAVHVVASDGVRVAQLDVSINAGLAWRPDVVTTIDYRVPLPPELATGLYELRVVPYSWTSGAQLPLWQAAEERSLDHVALGLVHIA